MKQQLQKRLTEEFSLRSTPLNTRLTYQRCIRCINRFERHFAASAATLGRAEVRQFLLHLVEHEKLSPITHNVHAAALYFLYANVLGRPRVVEKLPRRKGTQKLPVVLTPTEVARLLGVLGCNDCTETISTASYRIVRGGSFGNNASTVIVAGRDFRDQASRELVGFRCARSP